MLWIKISDCCHLTKKLFDVDRAQKQDRFFLNETKDAADHKYLIHTPENESTSPYRIFVKYWDQISNVTECDSL